MKLKNLAVVAVLGLAALSLAASDTTYSFKRTPKVGDVHKYKQAGKFDVAGMPIDYEANSTWKIIKVDDMGGYTQESTTTDTKINGEDGQFPDHGVIEGNTMTDTAPRVTENPIAPVDLVAANEWVIRGNIITDFIRAPGKGGEPPYGGFVKGEGEGNVLERNLVVCEWKLRDVPGERVGLSLGGGGTGMPFRRMKGLSGFEQVGGVVRDNLVAFCSDDGIYVNRSARSVIDHNTLLDTAGIDVRFIESSATVTANIVDGAIRKREGSSLQSWDNAMPFLPGLFAGLHPQRSLFRDPAALDLAWRKAPPPLAETEPRADLCGQERGPASPPGAFGDYAACLNSQ